MDRLFPARPWIAVGVLIVESDRLLLIQRGHDPGRGLWALPGGMVDLGETARAAAAREAREETGLDVEVGELIWIADAIGRAPDGRVEYHNVIVDFLATPTGGSPRHGDDAMDLRYFSADEIDRLPMSRTMYPLLEHYFRRSFRPVA
ncbi:MAG: NUDIX domain-containing protein [Chloroflexi bacterium]|nr:NUDIX domain-containing protein [Chloroflexota bacterium]